MDIGEIKGVSEWFGTFTMVAGALPENISGRRLDLLPWKPGTPAIFASPEDGKVWQMEPLDVHARTAIQQIRAGGAKSIVNVVATQNTKVVVRAQVFGRALQFPESAPLVILVTEAVESTIPDWGREKGILAFLESEFLANDIVYSLTGEDEGLRAFSLVGSRFLLRCRIGKLGHPQTVQLERKRRDPDSERITILRGAIRFEDARLATTQLASIRELTSQLQAQDDSFFGTWKVYQDLSETLLDQQRTEAGEVRYQKVSTVWENGSSILVFALSAPPHPAFLNEGIEVEVDGKGESDSRKDAKPVGQVLSRKQMLELRVSSNPRGDRDIPPKGTLRISQSGERVMLHRRQNALALLKEHQTALPTLSQLLEQGDAPIAQPRTWQAINERVLRILPNPTEQQRVALDVALNTPDIQTGRLMQMKPRNCSPSQWKHVVVCGNIFSGSTTRLSATTFLLIPSMMVPLSLSSRLKRSNTQLLRLLRLRPPNRQARESLHRPKIHLNYPSR